jgi:anti-sigma factor (TIGR02949 family)
MDCRTAQPLLEAYLDGELARADARELEQHIDGCADCRAALTRLDGVRRALREKSLRYAAPAALRERIKQAAMPDAAAGDRPAAASMPAPRRRAAPAGWWRIAAACVLAFGAGAVSMRSWHTPDEHASATSALARDLFASHWRALAAASPVDVVSSDRHTVKPWFAGKVAESPLVRDFAEQGFALVGGRVDYVGDERVAVLVYRHNQHVIDVFVVPHAGAAASSLTAEQQGYTLAPVRLGNQTAVVVTDMDREERARFTRLVESPP